MQDSASQQKELTITLHCKFSHLIFRGHSTETRIAFTNSGKSYSGININPVFTQPAQTWSMPTPSTCICSKFGPRHSSLQFLFINTRSKNILFSLKRDIFRLNHRC